MGKRKVAKNVEAVDGDTIVEKDQVSKTSSGNDDIPEETTVKKGRGGRSKRGASAKEENSTTDGQEVEEIDSELNAKSSPKPSKRGKKTKGSKEQDEAKNVEAVDGDNSGNDDMPEETTVKKGRGGRPKRAVTAKEENSTTDGQEVTEEIDSDSHKPNKRGKKTKVTKV